MTQGFAEAGFEPAFAVEFNLHAAATYAANFGEEHTFCGDIADVKESQVPSADVVIGGPPCQGFSNLGSKEINDPRNQLWREYVRIVRKANPKVFVIENVDRFMKSSEFALLLSEVRPGGLLDGYELSYGTLNAADFGVGQRRIRDPMRSSMRAACSLMDRSRSERSFVKRTRRLRLFRRFCTRWCRASGRSGRTAPRTAAPRR